ncbi:MAG: glycoside hydrolase family 28 protein [Vallitaleaceae bacterium]|nr:glycoside hydrolase family 28 protein [Vallitaleaceae bacterium]
MKFNIITLTSRSITIELINQEAYFAKNPYDLFINGEKVMDGILSNVISYYDLLPDTDYEISVIDKNTQENSTQSIRTLKESVCLDVRKFGAKGDGLHFDSPSIQAAILSCPKNGRVYIPAGTYLCAPIFLKSDMTLEIAEGACLMGHTDRGVYPILPGYTLTTDEQDEYYLGTWEGNPLDAYASLITGIHVENVAIIGKGIIDGNAQNSDWWVNPKIKKVAWRPRTVFLKGCKNVTLQGIRVQNSPSWTLHPYFSEELSFIDMTVQNHKDSPNTDGLDPESCNQVRIIGVNFSVGDDCIAIKAGKLYMGRKHKKPSENFVIRNCQMKHGHGAVVLGSEMAGGIRNIEVSQCIFEKTDRGLRIKTRRGRGKDAIIDHIHFRQIKMKEVLTPFVMNMFYFCDPDGKSEYVWTKEKLPVDEWTPLLGSFTFRDIECIDSEVAAAYFFGLPEQPIQEVRMENVFIQFKENAQSGQPAMMSFADSVCKKGIVAENVARIYLKNVRIEGYVGEYKELKNVDEIVEEE